MSHRFRLSASMDAVVEEHGFRYSAQAQAHGVPVHRTCWITTGLKSNDATGRSSSSCNMVKATCHDPAQPRFGAQPLTNEPSPNAVGAARAPNGLR